MRHGQSDLNTVSTPARDTTVCIGAMLFSVVAITASVMGHSQAMAFSKPDLILHRAAVVYG
jgi:hypothetical protein